MHSGCFLGRSRLPSRRPRKEPRTRQSGMLQQPEEQLPEEAEEKEQEAEALRAAAEIRQSAELEAKELRLKLRSEIDAEQRTHRGEIQREERRLVQREAADPAVQVHDFCGIQLARPLNRLAIQGRGHLGVGLEERARPQPQRQPPPRPEADRDRMRFASRRSTRKDTDN